MECMKIAREWLRNCLDNHDSCRGPAGSDRRLPSRVIDVGDEEHDPKLVVTDHAVGEYAVLSYCWGKSTHQHVTLSLQNLDAFQKLIPISSLRMTLQDAIFAARGLGIQYLWVDALCIIQDSVDDWTHEAGSMNDVYSNAVVALFATTAASAAEGFLGERIIKPTQYLMPHSVWKPDPSDPKTTDQDNPQIFLALNDWGAENDDAYHRDSKVYQWRKRGWTMQERLSPTRGISFNKIQMEWSCLTLAERENRLQIKHASQRQADLLDYVSSGYGVGLLSSLSERWNALIRIQEVQATHLGAENYEKLAIQLWYRLVNHYRTRELSNESDRLPAIAGLARILEDKMPGNHYLAGLWEKDLPLGFSWGVIAHHILPGRAQPASPLTRKESAATPSWSWASVAHGTYATYNFHEEVDESTTESLMFVHTPDAVSYRERFIPRSPPVLRITAPAMKLSNNWHSMEYPTEEQDLTQAALETLLRRKLSNDQAGKENSCDDIKELFRSSEFVQKHEPCPGQHFLIIQVFRRTPKDLDILESDVEFSSIFFLILESVPGRRNRYRRVLELHLAEGNMGRTGTDFILERQDQKTYKGNLLRMIRGQQWVNHDIELE